MSTHFLDSGWSRARSAGAVVAVVVLLGATASAASADSDISTGMAYAGAPGQGVSLPGMVVTNNGPGPAAGVTLAGTVPDADNEGHAVDWQIFTNKAAVSNPFGAFVTIAALSGPPFGADPCTFTSGTDYRCDIGPLAVGETRTVVFNPTWTVPNTATTYTQWHGFSYTADLVGGNDPDLTNNDDNSNFINNGFYYGPSPTVLNPRDFQVVEQSPPASGAYAPGATVTLKITSTVPPNDVGGSVSVVVPDPADVTCSGDGVCLTGGPQALTGPPNRVLVAMSGPPTPGSPYPAPPTTGGPYVFTTLLSAKLPTAAPAGCAPGKTVPYTFDTTQQPVMGGSALVSTGIIKLPLTVQIGCPDAPPDNPPPDNPPPSNPPPSNPPPSNPPPSNPPPSNPPPSNPPPAPRTDLAITKTASKSPIAGRRMRYTITVTNHGPDIAHGVVVTDKLSRKLRLISAKAKKGHCTKGRTVRCRLGDLAAGARVRIRLTVKARKAGAVRNTARVNSATTDTNANNNAATVKRRISGRARLSVRKRADHKTVMSGELIHFRIIVHNSRAATARHVRVCDRAPHGLAFVRASHAKRHTHAKTHKRVACWTIRRLARGKTRTLHVTARATGTRRPRTITNRVIVRAANARTRRASARVHVRPPVATPEFTG